MGWVRAGGAERNGTEFAATGFGSESGGVGKGRGKKRASEKLIAA